MKVTGDPLQYCAKLPANVRGVLLYGPNRLLLSEAVELLQKNFLPKDEKNDFSVVTMTPDTFKQNPGALNEELSSFGFFASNKFIHIKDADDNSVKHLQPAMELAAGDHFVVIEGDELGPRSALRVWGEKAENVACIPCYMLEGPALQRFIQGQFQQVGAKITGDAAIMLADRLGTDLSPLKNTIQQLVLYVGGDAPVVTPDHIEAMLVDQAEQEMDVVVQAVADANMAALDRALHNLHDAGTSMVGVLRVLQNYFYRLRTVQVAMRNGESIDAAMMKLKPPVFFKAKTAFGRHLRNWNLARIDGAIAEFVALEAACKKTGTPELLLVQYRLMRLCLKKAA